MMVRMIGMVCRRKFVRMFERVTSETEPVLKRLIQLIRLIGLTGLIEFIRLTGLIGLIRLRELISDSIARGLSLTWLFLQGFSTCKACCKRFSGIVCL